MHNSDGHAASDASGAGVGGAASTIATEDAGYGWDSQWFFEDDDNIMQGPVNLSDLHAWHLEGYLLPSTLLMRCTSGDEPMDGDFKLGNVLGLE